jgi:TrmH family RNA methyltransferase
VSPGRELEPAVVLVRPQEEGNVGAVARAMANMGLERLLLVEPAAPTRDQARAFAMHAHHVLDGARRHSDLAAATADFDVIVGTASLRERDWAQPVLAPRELPGWLAAEAAGARVALVFGPEVSGLANEELARANVLVSIPAAPAQPTLNLAQAVLILAYELYLARGAPGAIAPTPVARARVLQIDRLFATLEALLADVRFARDTTIQKVSRDLRQLLARAAVTEREATILSGILRRARHALARTGALPPAGRGGR